MPRQCRTLMMCSDCAHLRTTSRTCSLIDSFPVILTRSILSAVTRSMRGRHDGRLKARLPRRLSVNSSVNNAAACNPAPRPICSERNDVTSKTETEPENRVWPFPKPKNRFYKRNPVLETLVSDHVFSDVWPWLGLGPPLAVLRYGTVI